MTEIKFSELINDLSHFYERKQPRDDVKELWFQKVKRIPDECVGWICDKIMEECEYFPRNVVSMLWALFHQWLQANPDKASRTKEFVYCPECIDGIISVWKDISIKGRKPQQYSYIFRCGRCGQCDVKNWPMARLKVLMEAGYYVRNSKQEVSNKPANVKELAGGIVGKPMVYKLTPAKEVIDGTHNG